MSTCYQARMDMTDIKASHIVQGSRDTCTPLYSVIPRKEKSEIYGYSPTDTVA